ncbi:hypothetical protein ACWGB8_01945 [Kitasatospora sp. NPDC054939]
MATRFWLTNSAAPYTPTTRRGAWDVASGEDVQLLGRKPAGSAGTSSINAGSTAADRDVLLHRSISAGAVKAGTISGTVSWTIGARESNVDLNGVWHLHMYVTSGDSDTPRGTLLADYIGSSEFTTTATGTQVLAQAVNSVAVQVGDRIVVEIGYRATSLSTTYNATINYGSSGTTDLGSGDTAVTTNPGWIEFSGADGLYTAAFGTLVDAFTSSVDSKWTKSTNISATGGRARIPCTTTLESMYTATAYEIQGTAVKFQVPTLPATGGGSGAFFAAYLSAGPTVQTTNLEFLYTPATSNLQLRNNVGGSDGSPTNLTYNATDHAWWRFAETGGSITMDTSPDGSTWTTRRTISTPTQWMRQGSLILYLEAQRTSGTADNAEIDNVNNTTGQSIALGTATETATAQPVGRVKRLTAGTALESETAQTAGRAKTLTPSPAAETASAQAVGKAKTRMTSPAMEIEQVQSVTAVRAIPLASAQETIAVQAPGRAKARLLSPAVDTGTALAPAAAKTIALGTAAAVDTALAPGRTHARAINPAVETATAFTPGRLKTIHLAPATSIETAIPATQPSQQTTHGLRLTGTPTTPWTVHGTTTPWACTGRTTPVDALSTEYYEVGVTWDRGTPTSYGVDMAIVSVGHEPDTGDWHTAAWDTDSGGTGTVAKLLVGPAGGSVTPVPGRYRAWVRVEATPELPVLATAPFDIT